MAGLMKPAEGLPLIAACWLANAIKPAQLGDEQLVPPIFPLVGTELLPLCQTIRLAAYTQRPKARETDPIDTYILDLKFAREELRSFNPETTSIHSFLVQSGARFQMAADYQLERIEPPSWLNHEDIQNAPIE